MTSVEAQAEGDLDELTLLVADNSTSYFGVTHRTGRRIAKPYHAQVTRGGKLVHLGNFATAEEAALCVARSPEGWAAVAGSGAVGGESGNALCRAVWRHPQVEAATRAWVSGARQTRTSSGSRGSRRNARSWTVSRLLRGEAEGTWHHR